MNSVPKFMLPIVSKGIVTFIHSKKQLASLIKIDFLYRKNYLVP